ncbi:hypothetical protein IX321_002158 [Bacteroides pyogenes]|nr:hypothetical protein [Bacteroides pyogenes]MBR8747634.1 hypothetical protein [Bacteroides pyogenes]MBR8757991.1 hypothetical protein [Bacteroides pyogenes]MBR8781205.1 hypothetical protein [Bacteroides pyogenes]
MNKLIIRNITHHFHEKWQKKGDIVTFWRFGVFKNLKNLRNASSISLKQHYS